MSALNLRGIITDALRDPDTGLDPSKYAVGGYPGVPTRPSKRTVSVWPVELSPLPQAPSQYRAQLTVLVITPLQDPAKADDDLDEALGDVLDVMWATNGVLFDSATRTSFNEDTVQAWSLGFTVNIIATPED